MEARRRRGSSGRRWGRGRDELGEFAQVLSGGGEEKLVSGAARPAEPQAVELQVREHGGKPQALGQLVVHPVDELDTAFLPTLKRLQALTTRLGDGGFTGADLGFAPALGLESGVPGQA